MIQRRSLHKFTSSADYFYPISNAPGTSLPIFLIWSFVMPCAINSVTYICMPSACVGFPVCPKSVPRTKCAGR